MVIIQATGDKCYNAFFAIPVAGMCLSLKQHFQSGLIFVVKFGSLPEWSNLITYVCHTPRNGVPKNRQGKRLSDINA